METDDDDVIMLDNGEPSLNDSFIPTEQIRKFY